MEKRQEKSALVLKYGKRRYDGGNEIELIRAIERQKAMKQLNDLQKEHLVEVQADIAKQTEAATPIQQDSASASPLQTASSTSDPPIINKKLMEAFLLGPMELCIGSVGMLTATLGVIAFKHMQNEQLLAQSQVVFNDCWKTFKKGLLDSLTTPVRVFKAHRAII